MLHLAACIQVIFLLELMGIDLGNLGLEITSLISGTAAEHVSELSSPLIAIFNKSFEQLVVPTNVKVARVIHMYEAENKKNM